MTNSITLLVVEDNHIDREIFRRLLQGNSMGEFHYEECDRGQAALEQIQRLRPDCALLDLNLPDIDGIEVLRSITADPGLCPVIVITAHGSEQIAVDAMKAGAADYLVKGSVSEETLGRVVLNAIERRRLHREIEQQRLSIEVRNRDLERALEREQCARTAVEQSEARYRVLARAMPQLVWTANHPRGDWDYVNERWTQLTGEPESRSIDSGWLDFIDPEDRERVEQQWQRAVREVRPLDLECRVRASWNMTRLHLMRAVPVVSGGLTVKWVGTLTDIEEQRRNEELLRQRQKLDSIGILAGGVAHDFNNLLVGVVGGISYSLDVLADDHELRPTLEDALKAGERAAELTRQLLAYAGRGSFRTQDVELSSLIGETWSLIQASISRSIQLEMFLPPDLPTARSDPAQLQQVLMNLVLNAGEAIPEGRAGRIGILADSILLDAAPANWDGEFVAGRYVSIRVRDNGVGIEPNVLHRIFDPFFTTKFTGRGVGLAAVYGIIRRNRGSIQVESTPGEGTTFRVLLPAGEMTRNNSGTAFPDSPAPFPKPASILVVDDEQVVRSTVTLVLQRLGHAVHTASNGQEAVDRVKAAPDLFSLVLLDLNMPGLDGEQTSEAICAIRPTLPIVICSGLGDSEVRNRFLDRPIAGFLQKPFRAETLSHKLAEILSSTR